MINVLYIHGYNSSSTSPSVKITQLENEFKTVYRIAPNYDLGYEATLKEVLDFVKHINSEEDAFVDALIGTSMGGYLSAVIAEKLVIPFVCINPVIYPSITLEKYGLYSNVLSSYPDFLLDGKTSALALIGMKDSVIDPIQSLALLSSEMPIIEADACHQFPDLSNWIGDIADFLYSVSAYGPSKSIK